MTTPADVDSLSSGDHACLTFSDPQERLDIVAAFVAAGLDQGQKIICFTESLAPPQLTAELADRGVPALADLPPGQLTVRSSEESWFADGELLATKMVDLIARQLDLSTAQGYPGLRVTADMGWAARPGAAADQLTSFEAEAAKLFTDRRLTAICQYDRQLFDAVTLAFAAAAHQPTVAAPVYHEDPFLRICRQHRPPGIRVAGEIDYRHRDALTKALSESLRLDHDIHVNLAQLHFMDAASAGVIAQAAVSLPAGRIMHIVCAGVAHTVLGLVGVGELANVRVTRLNGER